MIHVLSEYPKTITFDYEESEIVLNDTDSKRFIDFLLKLMKNEKDRCVLGSICGTKHTKSSF